MDLHRCRVGNAAHRTHFRAAAVIRPLAHPLLGRRVMRSSMLLLTLVPACASYAPGSFAARGQPFAGHGVTRGCLDVAVEVANDAYASGPVATFQFGNRCDHEQVVDLASVVVTGRTTDGKKVALSPHDPKGEIVALPLDARMVGRERIEYEPTPSGVELASVCLDLERIAGADGPPRPPLCFRFTVDSQIAKVMP